MQLTPGAPEKLCRSHNFDSLVLGRVCKDCNDGWMGKVETAAKVDLTGLIEGCISLDRPLALARWALKTSYTLCRATDAPVGRVPPRHMHFLRTESGLPRGVSVFYRLDSQDEWWFSSATTFHAGFESKDLAYSRVIAERHQRNGFRYFFRLGRLTLLCEFWPDDSAHIEFQPDLLKPVFSERITRPVDDGYPGFGESVYDLLFRGTRYWIGQAGAQDRSFCQCGSGLVSPVCRLAEHPENTAGNWGWLPIDFPLSLERMA